MYEYLMCFRYASDSERQKRLITCDEDVKRIILHIVSVRARVSTTPPHAQASMTRKACADKQMSEKEMWNV